MNLIYLNGGREGKLLVDYVVGSDHMHWFAPAYKDANGKKNTAPFHPIVVSDNGVTKEYSPDTIQRINVSITRPQTMIFLTQQGISVRILFKERDEKESAKMAEEVSFLDPLEKQGFYIKMRSPDQNQIDPIDGASSTNIRNALAGFGNPDDLVVLPMAIEGQIMVRDQYRGHMMDVPGAIIRLSHKASKPDEIGIDRGILKGWLAGVRNKGIDITPAEVAQMLSVSDKILTEQDVRRAMEDISSAKAANSDNAQTVEGGIDFNKNLDIDTDGEQIDIRFDKAMVAQFKHGDFSGVRPLILSITPVAHHFEALFGK